MHQVTDRPLADMTATELRARRDELLADGDAMSRDHPDYRDLCTDLADVCDEIAQRTGRRRVLRRPSRIRARLAA